MLESYTAQPVKDELSGAAKMEEGLSLIAQEHDINPVSSTHLLHDATTVFFLKQQPPCSNIKEAIYGTEMDS